MTWPAGVVDFQAASLRREGRELASELAREARKLARYCNAYARGKGAGALASCHAVTADRLAAGLRRYGALADEVSRRQAGGYQ